MPKLTKRLIDKTKPSDERRWLWDTDVSGFGCCVHPTGRAVFYLKYRTSAGRVRKPKIGAYGDITLDQARKIARQWLAEAARGGDPSADRKASRAAPTVADLSDRYLREHARPHKKASSVRMDEINLRKHVLPALGPRKVAGLSHSDVVRLHQAVGKQAPGAANRVIALLSKMLNLAEKWGLREPGSNPCRHITKFREKKVERYLRPDEYKRLQAALRVATDENEVEPMASDLFRLVMFTGCRLGEIRELRRNDYDEHRRELILRDAKTGGRRVALADAAADVVERLLASRDGETPGGWMFPFPGRGSEPVSNGWIWYRWRFVRARAELNDLRIHDLRHAFASAAAEDGLSLTVIGKMLGHRTPATTARYAHLAEQHAAANRVASVIAGGNSNVVQLKKAGKRHE